MIFFNLLPSVISALICNVNFLGCYVILKTRNEIEEKIAGCITNSNVFNGKHPGHYFEKREVDFCKSFSKIKKFFCCFIPFLILKVMNKKLIMNYIPCDV